MTDPDRPNKPPSVDGSELIDGLLEELLLNVPDPDERRRLSLALKGMWAVFNNPDFKRGLSLFNELTPLEREDLKSPVTTIVLGRQFAHFLRSSSRKEIENFFSAGWAGERMSRARTRSLSEPSAVAETAREIEEEADRQASLLPPGIEVPPTGTGTLSEEEKTRLKRALRSITSSKASVFRAAGESNPEDRVTLLLGAMGGASRWGLFPPDTSDHFGKRNRSPPLLPNDRRPCAARGCTNRVRNDSVFCPIHRLEAKRDREARRKKRQRDRNRLRRSTRIASNSSTSLSDRDPEAGALPEELAPRNHR